MIELTQEIVRELLDYDPVTGVLTWKRRDRRWFKRDLDWKTWNTTHAERCAFSALDDKGYLVGTIFHKRYRSHRVIFLWMTGRWPADEIDHENHDRADNRWGNLFESSHGPQHRNMSLFKTNTSGRVGVTWDRNNGKWTAQIGGGNRVLYLGQYDVFEDARAVRADAERKYGYHERHGEKSVSLMGAI